MIAFVSYMHLFVRTRPCKLINDTIFTIKPYLFQRRRTETKEGKRTSETRLIDDGGRKEREGKSGM